MTLRDVDYQTLSDALRAYSGAAVDRRRADLLEARLEHIARARGMKGIAPLLDDMRTDGSDLVDDLVNCETSFFRDAPAFAALRELIIPRVIAKRAPQRRLRVLCAGCSTGQEPYSVAMLLRESFPELLTWHLEITGVDISSKRIERATSGVYERREVERGVPQALVRRYFQEQSEQLRIIAPLRAIVQFRRVNLVEPWLGLVGYDVVLLRNLLIYLDDDAKAAMLRHARDSMHKQGFLLLGSAETARGHAFDRVPWAPYPVYTPSDR